MFYYKKHRKKRGKKNKLRSEQKQSFKKRFMLNETEALAMFDQVRKNLSDAVKVRGY